MTGRQCARQQSPTCRRWEVALCAEARLLVDGPSRVSSRSRTLSGDTPGTQLVSVTIGHKRTATVNKSLSIGVISRSGRSCTYVDVRRDVTENHGVGGSIPPLGTIPH